MSETKPRRIYVSDIDRIEALASDDKPFPGKVSELVTKLETMEQEQ